MNLRTRRFTEKEFSQWLSLPEVFGLAFRVSDRFGEYGVTGLGTIKSVDTVAFITDFVLSCRVMGRGVENAMLSSLIDLARIHQIDTVRATHQPTDRNMPCEAFFETHSKFDSEGGVYSWQVKNPYKKPDFIESKHSNGDYSQP